MASGVSVSGRRHYDSAYSSAGNHLVAGRPFAKTFKITHGADSTDDSILTFVSPTAGVAATDFEDTTVINGITKYGQLIKIQFPSTMSQVQVSVQEVSSSGTPANLQARVLFVAPGQAGADGTFASPIGNSGVLPVETGNYVQLGDTPTAPEGAVTFSTAMNQIYILISTENPTNGAAIAPTGNESITFLVTGHMPLNESDVTPAYDLSTFTFGDDTGIG